MEFNKYMLIRIRRFCLLLFMTVSLSAQATAPRISAELFGGEEAYAEIVSYYMRDASAQADTQFATQIVTEAFKLVEETQLVDTLPSRYLAKYALVNHDVVALMGRTQDVPAKDKKRYYVITFYLTGIADSQEHILLIINKGSRGAQLKQRFNQGLKKLVNSGKYKELLEAHYGEEPFPVDYFTRLKKHNSALK